MSDRDLPDAIPGKYHILHALPDTLYPRIPRPARAEPSEKVVELSLGIFDRVIQQKEKALVLFYNGKWRRTAVDEAFEAAAKRSSNERFVFGRVDCHKNNLLCSGEDTCSPPVLKVYSYGFEVSMIRNPGRMNADQIFMLIMMTPTMPSHKINLSQSITSKGSSIFGKCFGCK